jgi:hypothetical protein
LEVEPPTVHQIVPLDEVAVRAHVERVAVFVAQGRSGPKRIGVPRTIIDILLRKTQHAAPEVKGVLHHPVVLADGTILARPGIHERTGLLVLAASSSAMQPYSKEQAREAMGRLRAGVLDGFVFASTRDADVAIAMLVTMLQRRVLDLAPGFAILANMQSSGKTTLARRMHVIATGQDMPVSTFAQGDESEVAKRLLSALMRSPEVICFDNLTDGTTFRSGAIASAMTGPSYSQRLLGRSSDVDVPTNTTFLITGNNLSLGADESSRWLPCWLGSTTARPQERHFENADTVGYALSIRDCAIADVIGIISGYLTSGEEMRSATRFPMWDRIVRQALIWAGASDMAQVFRANVDDSEDAQAHVALLSVLQELFGERGSSQRRSWTLCAREASPMRRMTTQESRKCRRPIDASFQPLRPFAPRIRAARLLSDVC